MSIGRVALPASGSSASTTASIIAAGSETRMNDQKKEVRTDEVSDNQSPSQSQPAIQSNATKFMEQVLDWIKNEKQRVKERAARREEKKAKKRTKREETRKLRQQEQPAEVGVSIPGRETPVKGDENLLPNVGSPDSITSTSTTNNESTDSLDQLEKIVQASLAASTASLVHSSGATVTPPSRGTPARPPFHRKRSLRPHSRPATAPGSDTEATADGDVIVPECEVTLGTPEKIGWNEFSSEVLKLTHTLRCKGWRRIALDRYKELEIKRISGALTNVVYMVSPPPIIEEDASDSRSTRKPSKLLLRIYGAQVSHLIDRETELSILRRLARKKIGPRLLGTFVNGRFEEFFNAETLTKDDIRNPETSRQIAKRMRELHEGVDLEDHEIRAGPVVWLNWGKWVNRAREIMKAVEAQGGQKGGMLAWEMFENAVKRYREWLVARYGGEEGLRKELVFAHNDTQYGNILRLKPIGDSPLLLPMNTHKQLIVIDFEYASANCPGFEFANHFCEWMANYHSPDAPHVVHESFFPTLQEQRNFLRAYVGHWLPGTRTPSYQKLPPSSTSSTPTHAAATPPGQFMLDSRTPFGLSNSYKEEEIARQAALEAEAERLREEARAWRPASHAMWAAWGVVQAKIPTSGDKGSKDGEEKAPPMTEGDKEMEVEGEFDYLGYAQQRVLLFWGDMISLGIMSEEEVGRVFKKVEGGLGMIKQVE